MADTPRLIIANSGAVSRNSDADSCPLRALPRPPPGHRWGAGAPANRDWLPREIDPFRTVRATSVRTER